MIERPNPMQRAYIEALGCQPLSLIKPGANLQISRVGGLWRSGLRPDRIFWYGTAQTVDKVHTEVRHCLENQPLRAELFEASVRAANARLGVSSFEHAALMGMADRTVEVIEQNYQRRKADGEFREFFRNQRRLRQEAALLGVKAGSAARDETHLKIQMLRKAICHVR